MCIYVLQAAEGTAAMVPSHAASPMPVRHIQFPSSRHGLPQHSRLGHSTISVAPQAQAALTTPQAAVPPEHQQTLTGLVTSAFPTSTDAALSLQAASERLRQQMERQNQIANGMAPAQGPLQAPTSAAMPSAASLVQFPCATAAAQMPASVLSGPVSLPVGSRSMVAGCPQQCPQQLPRPIAQRPQPVVVWPQRVVGWPQLDSKLQTGQSSIAAVTTLSASHPVSQQQAMPSAGAMPQTVSVPVQRPFAAQQGAAVSHASVQQLHLQQHQQQPQQLTKLQQLTEQQPPKQHQQQSGTQAQADHVASDALTMSRHAPHSEPSAVAAARQGSAHSKRDSNTAAADQALGQTLAASDARNAASKGQQEAVPPNKRYAASSALYRQETCIQGNCVLCKPIMGDIRHWHCIAMAKP